MAGHLPLGRRGAFRLAAAFTLLAGSALLGAAQTAPMEMAPAQPAANPAPAPPPKPVIPPVPVDYFQRYGKIIAPGTEPSHPLSLKMPFPDVGQVKIPTAEETALRDKLERLTTMSDDDIRKDLAEWPAFEQMSLSDEGAMLTRIQMFKDYRTKQAQACAKSLGLLTLNPAQMEKFTGEYWEKRLQMDRDLSKQFEPIYKARESQMEEQLFREYSTPMKPGVAQKPAAKPQPTALTQAKVGEDTTTAPMQPMLH
jgi:hypothetical protein